MQSLNVMERIASSYLFLMRPLHSNALPFKIPEPIKRSPTELLEALAGTVKPDPTAPHFSFIDDPLTIPTSASQIRQYYMCKEYGKRAARKLVEEWPTLFMFDRDTPYLDAFRPEKPLDPAKIDPTEENLQKMIAAKHIKSALKLYNRLKNEKIPISENILLDLFRLSCYYNGQNIPQIEDEEWHGLRNFSIDNEAQGSTDTPKFAWNEQDNQAEILFDNLPKNEATYSTLICGLLSYPSPQAKDRALELYKEMVCKGFIPHEEVFNLMISRSIPYWEKNPRIENKARKDVNSKCVGSMWVKAILTAGIRPSVKTYNALLSSLKEMSDKDLQSLFISIFNEMKAVEVAPNLTTYWLTLKRTYESEAITRMGGYKPLINTLKMLKYILNELELSSADSFLPVDESCCQFFYESMFYATNLGNSDLADRILRLYETKFDKVRGTFPKEQRFYQQYLLLKMAHSSPQEALLVYQSIVPRVLGLDRVIILSILKNDKILENWDLLNRLIQDTISTKLFASGIIGGIIRRHLLSFDYQKLFEQGQQEYKELVLKIIDLWVEHARIDVSLNPQKERKLSLMQLVECILLLLKIEHIGRAHELLGILFNENFYTGDEGHERLINPEGYVPVSVLKRLYEQLPPNLKIELKEKVLPIFKKYHIGTPKSSFHRKYRHERHR